MRLNHPYPPILVYGAYGHTGRFIVSELIDKGFTPVLSGRDRQQLADVSAGTGVFVIPAVPYLQALDLNKDDLIQALGLSFTISTVALAIGLARGGAFHFSSIATSAFAMAPALMGMWFGQWIRRHIAAALVPDLPCPSWSRTRRSAIFLMQAALDGSLGGGFDAWAKC
jgi:hypothetical protein